MSFTSKCTCGHTSTMDICDGKGDGKCQKKININDIGCTCTLMGDWKTLKELNKQTADYINSRNNCPVHNTKNSPFVVLTSKKGLDIMNNILKDGE